MKDNITENISLLNIKCSLCIPGQLCSTQQRKSSCKTAADYIFLMIANKMEIVNGNIDIIPETILSV